MRPSRNVHAETGRDLWRARAERTPERPFVVHAGRTWAFGEADATMLRLAGGLAELGIGPGARVLVGMPNGADTLLVHAALRELGAILVPLMPGLAFDELAYQARHSEAESLIAADPIASTLLPRLSELPAVHTVVRAGPEVESLASHAPVDPHRAVPVDDMTPWAIFYTSGSSGHPKGVVLPAGAFTSGGMGYADRFEIGPGDNFFLATTMAHAVGGLTAQCIALYAGCRLTIVDRFSPSSFWTAVGESAATVSILFPAHLNLLLETQADAPPAGSIPLRLVITHSWIESFRRRFGVELALCWGMTETGAGSTGTLPGYRGGDEGYVGPPMDGVEIAINDGEICVRNRHRMLEYLSDPEATRDVLVDGWIRSGDRGRIDAHGGLWFQGRIKNVIKRSGENISPEEIETLLATHEAVAECVVLGVPDRIRTEEVAAIVLRRAGREVTEAELAAFVAARLARWKAPRYVLVTDEPLPRLGNGKIDRRRALRELDVTACWDREAGQRQGAAPSNP